MSDSDDDDEYIPDVSIIPGPTPKTPVDITPKVPEKPKFIVLSDIGTKVEFPQEYERFVPSLYEPRPVPTNNPSLSKQTHTFLTFLRYPLARQNLSQMSLSNTQTRLREKMTNKLLANEEYKMLYQQSQSIPPPPLERLTYVQSRIQELQTKCLTEVHAEEKGITNGLSEEVHVRKLQEFNDKKIKFLETINALELEKEKEKERKRKEEAIESNRRKKEMNKRKKKKKKKKKLKIQKKKKKNKHDISNISGKKRKRTEKMILEEDDEEPIHHHTKKLKLDHHEKKIVPKVKKSRLDDALDMLRRETDNKDETSTLQKSRDAWEIIKQKGEFKEEVEYRAKDYYLEKQDFLERVEDREFERKRNLRIQERKEREKKEKMKSGNRR